MSIQLKAAKSKTGLRLTKAPAVRSVNVSRKVYDWSMTADSDDDSDNDQLFSKRRLFSSDPTQSPPMMKIVVVDGERKWVPATPQPHSPVRTIEEVTREVAGVPRLPPLSLDQVNGSNEPTGSSIVLTKSDKSKGVCQLHYEANGNSKAVLIVMCWALWNIGGCDLADTSAKPYKLCSNKKRALPSN